MIEILSISPCEFILYIILCMVFYFKGKHDGLNEYKEASKFLNEVVNSLNIKRM